MGRRDCSRVRRIKSHRALGGAIRLRPQRDSSLVGSNAMLENWWRQGERANGRRFKGEVIRARFSEQGATMSDQGAGESRSPKRPGGPGQGGPKSNKGGAAPKKRGGLRLKRLLGGDGQDFELDHPKCVHEMELDFEEGIEFRKAGDPEAARDALRYALQGCGDNMWVHVALGWIALEDFKDPTLARGHFGYAFELAERAFPPGFSGRLPQHRAANQPFYDAIDGLIGCYEALDKPGEVRGLRDLADSLVSGRRGGPAGPQRGPAKPRKP